MHPTKIVERFHNRYIIIEPSGCWIWMSYGTGHGYGQMKFRGRVHLAHRLSWEIHNGSIPDGLWVLHKCDVKYCVNPSHLYLGARQQNVQDAVERHRMASGVRHGSAKLTQPVADEIRSFQGLISNRKLAAIYGLSPRHVNDLMHGRYWPATKEKSDG